MGGRPLTVRVQDNSELLKPELLGFQSGCLTIVTRTVRRVNGLKILVQVKCSICGQMSWSYLDRIKRTEQSHCKLCTQKIPRWLRKRTAAQRDRCINPKNRAYVNYGGRGIQFRFKDTQEASKWIVDNLGLPDRELGLTLDRIDNDGHYEPGNLRWASDSEQMKNRRKLKTKGWLPEFRKKYPHVNFPFQKMYELRKKLTDEEIAMKWELQKSGTS